MRSSGTLLYALLFILPITGCGTFVPQVRDFPYAGSETQNNLLVQAIIISIRCELQDAVTGVINADIDTAKANRFYYAQFLKGWGAQVSLTLRLEEKSTVNPTGVFLPVSPVTSVFSLAGGLSATADATRIDKVNFYYKVSDLYLGRDRKCIRDTNPPRDSLLIQSDLKLAEWLDAMINGTATGIITAVSNKNVLSHQITFQVTTSGNLTPAWRLVRGTVNQSGTFLSATRDRQHDLLVTFGPLDPGQSGSFLLPIAESSHNSSQVISGVTTGFKSALGQ